MTPANRLLTQGERIAVKDPETDAVWLFARNEVATAREKERGLLTVGAVESMGLPIFEEKDGMFSAIIDGSNTVSSGIGSIIEALFDWAENNGYDYKSRQSPQATAKLIAAAEKAGIKTKSYFPHPLQLWLSDHDTGTQARIYLKDANADHQPVGVWYGSAWVSPVYEHNDEAEQGFTTDTGFAHGQVRAAFNAIAREVIKRAAQDEATRFARIRENKNKRAGALAHYQQLFAQARGQGGGN